MELLEPSDRSEWRREPRPKVDLRPDREFTTVSEYYRSDTPDERWAHDFAEHVIDTEMEAHTQLYLEDLVNLPAAQRFRR